MIRGRQGRSGFRDMSVSTFCDIVWAEIWDDCSPMGDVAQYRDIMHRLIIQGDPPSEITYTDSKGKVRKLSERKHAPGQPAPKDLLDQARSMLEEVRQAKEEVGVASAPDG